MGHFTLRLSSVPNRLEFEKGSSVLLTAQYKGADNPAALRVVWKRCDFKGGPCERVLERSKKFTKVKLTVTSFTNNVFQNGDFAIASEPLKRDQKNQDIRIGRLTEKYTGYYVCTIDFYRATGRKAYRAEVGFQLNVIGKHSSNRNYFQSLTFVTDTVFNSTTRLICISILVYVS